MKKIFALIFCFILFILSALTVCAENETYFIKELNFSIDIPSDYIVFTRNMEDSFTLKKYGYTSESLTKALENNSIYLDAFSNSVSEEIVVTAFELDVSDICIFDDEELEELAKAGLNNYKEQGAEILDCDVYTNTKTTYIITTYIDPIEGNGINYYTINNYYAINITCWTYDNELNDSNKKFFAETVDSITFHAYNGLTTLPDTDDNSDTATQTAPVYDDNFMIYENTFTFSIAENGKLTPFGNSLIASAVIILVQITAGVILLIVFVNKAKKRRKAALSAEAVQSDIKFCIYCSTQLNAYDTFCHKCGNRQVASNPNKNSDI